VFAGDKRIEIALDTLVNRFIDAYAKSGSHDFRTFVDTELRPNEAAEKLNPARTAGHLDVSFRFKDSQQWWLAIAAAGTADCTVVPLVEKGMTSLAGPVMIRAIKEVLLGILCERNPGYTHIFTRFLRSERQRSCLQDTEVAMATFLEEVARKHRAMGSASKASTDLPVARGGSGMASPFGGHTGAQRTHRGRRGMGGRDRGGAAGGHGVRGQRGGRHSTNPAASTPPGPLAQ
jgi:hypothetical protein